MNCQDVNEILDSLSVDGLPSGQRQQVEAHLVTCADCARAWNAQFALAALPDEPMPAGLGGQCLAMVAAHVPAAASTRRHDHRRHLIWGSLTAVAAAAIMLLWLPREEPWTTPAGTVPASGVEAESQAPAVATAVETAAEEESAPGLPGSMAVGLAPGPGITVEVGVQEPAPMGPDGLQAIVADPYARQVKQSLHAALVGELRKVPNLEVVQEVPAQLVAPARHYRLKILSLQMYGVDGRPQRKENQYTLALNVEEVKSSGSTIPRPLPFAFAVDPLATCTNPDDPSTRPCDVSTTAAFLVRELRKQIFPADLSVIQPMQARFRDFSLPPDERFQAFVELFKLQAKADGKDLLGDPQVVRAAVELSQLTDATHRAQLWRALRGIGDPELVDPLLTSLQQDSGEARIAAAETLAVDFSGNPRVLAALESTAISDPDALVRALARRGVSGEGAWQAYVESSLKDSTLPASRRIEALLHELYPPDTINGIPDGSPASYRQILQDLDDASVAALAEVFPKAEQLRKWPGNNLIGNFAGAHSQHPAVKQMLLTVLAQDSRAPNRSVAGEMLAVRHAGDPQVRQALTRAASTDQDASVRDYLRQVLDRGDVKKAMQAPAP